MNCNPVIHALKRKEKRITPAPAQMLSKCVHKPVTVIVK
jgi:hypothetical protein